jgi:hypothetical protein
VVKAARGMAQQPASNSHFWRSAGQPFDHVAGLVDLAPLDRLAAAEATHGLRAGLPVNPRILYHTVLLRFIATHERL